MTYENDPLELGLGPPGRLGPLDDASISMAALRAIKEPGVRRRINGVELDGIRSRSSTTSSGRSSTGDRRSAR
jgi:hypothetical protein